MKGDYLWDGSGEPDPEVQKLDSLLGRFRHNQPAPTFDQVTAEQPVPRRWRLTFRFSFQLAAVAAVLLIGVATFFVFRAGHSQDSGRAWEIARIEGAPRVGRHSLKANAETAKLEVGQTLVTDNSSRARDRKSTRLNSSHLVISYAVFCLKKKKKIKKTTCI